jgi:dihydroorotate dehydrogenase electron transfer subunit
MSKKEVKDFLVIENRQLNQSNFLVKLKSDEHLSELFPGQFVNIEIPEEKEVFLRRPFSIFEADYINNTISLIVKILGKGSKKLTEISPGKILNMVLPLGKGFTLPAKTDNVLLLGGGSGMAPMLFLAKKSGLKKEQVHILIGARSQADHIDLNEYSEYGLLYYTTEDGERICNATFRISKIFDWFYQNIRLWTLRDDESCSCRSKIKEYFLRSFSRKSYGMRFWSVFVLY